MKLRLQRNSLRLRLKQGEVRSLVQDGSLREDVVFGPGANGDFHFVLEASDMVTRPEASLQESGVVVRVPTKSIRYWATSDEVGIDALQETEGASPLRILIEKDFACIDGPAEENVDTFPNPGLDVNAESHA